MTDSLDAGIIRVEGSHCSHVLGNEVKYSQQRKERCAKEKKIRTEKYNI